MMTWKLTMDLGARKAGKKNILFSIDIRTRGATSWNQKTMTKDFVGGKKKTITTKMIQTNSKGFLE